MPITDYRGETSLKALAERLYPLPTGRADRKAASKQAEAALKLANPGLTNASKLKAGTVLAVPSIPGLEPRDVAAPLTCLSRVLGQLITLAEAKTKPPKKPPKNKTPPTGTTPGKKPLKPS